MADTFIRTFCGRDIEFLLPRTGQLLILQRLSQRLQEAAGGTQDEGELGKIYQKMIKYALDAVDSLIIHEEDREFLEQKLVTNKLTYQELQEVLRGPQPAPEPTADDADVAPKPRKNRRAAR